MTMIQLIADGFAASFFGFALGAICGMGIASNYLAWRFRRREQARLA